MLNYQRVVVDIISFSKIEHIRTIDHWAGTSPGASGRSALHPSATFPMLPADSLGEETQITLKKQHSLRFLDCGPTQS